MSDQQVRETLARAARRRRIQQAVIGIGLLLVLAVLARAAVDARNTATYLKDCTTPSTATETHACYEEGQRRTAEAINTLLEGQRYNRNLIVCVLSIPAPERTPDAKAVCRRRTRNP